jgi:hypothetical protein
MQDCRKIIQTLQWSNVRVASASCSKLTFPYIHNYSNFVWRITGWGKKSLSFSSRNYLYGPHIFKWLNSLLRFHDVRHSEVQRTAYFTFCTTSILRIKCWFLKIAVMNHWNLFYRILVSTSFNKSFFVFLGLAIFSQTFQKDLLPITP